MTAALTGCSCGKVLLTRGAVAHFRGVCHRAGNPCYALGGSKQAGVPLERPLEERVLELERVVTDLALWKDQWQAAVQDPDEWLRRAAIEPPSALARALLGMKNAVADLKSTTGGQGV